MAVLLSDRLKNNSFPILISLLVLTIPVAPGRTQEAGEVAQTPTASTQDIRQLEQGKPIERQLAGDEKHSYQVTVQAGQYLHVLVTPKDIDVVVSLLTPDGKQIIEVDGLEPEDSESVEAIVEILGNYRVEIRPFENSDASGSYEVKIEELREATAQDKNRVAAEIAFVQASKLYMQQIEGTRIITSGQEQESVRQQIVTKYLEALQIYQTLGNRHREANTLKAICDVYKNYYYAQDALNYCEKALQIYQQLGNIKAEAETLKTIGHIYKLADFDDKQKALDYFNQALQLFQQLNDRAKVIDTLLMIRFSYGELGGTQNRQQELEISKQLLELYRATGNAIQEANTLIDIGSFYRNEAEKAAEFYNQALQIYRKLSDRTKEVSTLQNIAAAYESSGNYQKAIEYYNLTFQAFQSLGDRSGEADTLLIIGSFYRENLLDYQKAIDYFTQMLKVYQDLGDLEKQAMSLDYIAATYFKSGNYPQAIDSYNQALTLRQPKDVNSAIEIPEIIKVYEKIGDYNSAINYFHQWLQIARSQGDSLTEGTILMKMGNFCLDFCSGIENYKLAIEPYNQALKIFSEHNNYSEQIMTLTNLGILYQDRLNEPQKAIEYYDRGLKIYQETGEGWLFAAAILSEKAVIYKQLGEKQKALDYFNQAFKLFPAKSILLEIAFLEREFGDFATALAHIETALKDVEQSSRTYADSVYPRVQHDRTREERITYFSEIHKYYELYIDILMQLHKQQPSEGYDKQALEVSERSRARILLELLSAANTEIRQGVDPLLSDRKRTLNEQINELAKRQAELPRNENTNKEAAEIEAQIQALLTTYQQLQLKIQQDSPRYAALTQPQPLKLAEIQQQVLDDNTILLEYSLGEEGSYLWMVTKNSITSYELPKSADIEAAAKELRLLLTDSEISQDLEKVAETSAKLSQIILAPVAEKLRQKRLVIVADGILQYIPFAALTKATTSKEYVPLIIDHEIINLPSASTLAISRKQLQGRATAPKTIAILADPVFGNNDDRLQIQAPSTNTENLALSTLSRSADETNVTFDRLPFTELEANAIIALISNPNQSQEILGFAADRTAATSSNLAQYRIVHFATHGLMNPTNPELSGLVMSLVDKDGKPANGFLRLNDIFNLELSADLVVMSACQTATGKVVKGEGIVGLTRGFMYAGAARVMASLWSVNDPATSQLMTKFYQRYLKEGLPAAAALRAAQLEMFKQEEWHSPYYWAAFTLQGEWK